MAGLTWGWHNPPQWSRCREESANCSWMIGKSRVAVELGNGTVTWQHLAKQMASPHCGEVSPAAQVLIFWPGEPAPGQVAACLHRDDYLHLVLEAPCSVQNSRPLLGLPHVVLLLLLLLRRCLDHHTLPVSLQWSLHISIFPFLSGWDDWWVSIWESSEWKFWRRRTGTVVSLFQTVLHHQLWLILDLIILKAWNFQSDIEEISFCISLLWCNIPLFPSLIYDLF